MAECDAQFTKDRQVVIMHDSDTFRTTGCHNLLKDRTLKELKQLDFSYGMDAYRGERIPTLEELLQMAKEIDLDVNIELKTNLDQPLWPGRSYLCHCPRLRHGGPRDLLRK